MKASQVGESRRRLRRARRALRGALMSPYAAFGPSGRAPPPNLRRLRRILLVAFHPRLGNALLATPGVAALRDALPEARLDLVGGPHAETLYAGFGLERIVSLRPGDPFASRGLAAVVRALRRERYEAAVHVSTAARSLGAFLTGSSGAAHRIGCAHAGENAFFTSALMPPPPQHKVDALLAYVRSLGLPAAGERRLALSPGERRWAADTLAQRLGPDSDSLPAAVPVAVFVGARERKGKAWSLASFAAVLRGLRERGLRPIVFLGPEETSRGAAIRATLGEALYVEESDLRRVAALVSHCRAALAPDSGPMHLAIAAGVPTVALFRRANFERWGPRPPRGEVVFDPAGADSKAALAAMLRACGAG